MQGHKNTYFYPYFTIWDEKTPIFLYFTIWDERGVKKRDTVPNDKVREQIVFKISRRLPHAQNSRLGSLAVVPKIVKIPLMTVASK